MPRPPPIEPPPKRGASDAPSGAAGAFAGDTRVDPAPAAADETVEVTNPMAKVVREVPADTVATPQAASTDTRVDKKGSGRTLAPEGADPSFGETLPLPRIPEPASSAPGPVKEAAPDAPSDLARRATVLKVTPETLQSWLTEGPSGEHKVQTPDGFRPLIQDLKEELEAESRRPPEEAQEKPKAPLPERPDLLPRPSSERTPQASASGAPPGLRRPSALRAKAKRLSNTLSMLLEQEAASRRRGFLYGVLAVAFLSALAYFALVYLLPHVQR